MINTIKRLSLLVLAGVICCLFSFNNCYVVDEPIIKIEDTRVINGKLDALMSSSLILSTLYKQRFQVDISTKTFIIWQDIDKEERIELTLEAAQEFVKSRQCWILVGVYKGVANNIILYPDEFK